MALLRVPRGCSSVTFDQSGVQAASSVNGVWCVTCNAVELTDQVQSWNSGEDATIETDDITTGALQVGVSTHITSITMNGTVYAVTNGVSAAMSAVDATQWIYEGTQLVTG